MKLHYVIPATADVSERAILEAAAEIIETRHGLRGRWITDGKVVDDNNLRGWEMERCKATAEHVQADKVRTYLREEAKRV